MDIISNLKKYVDLRIDDARLKIAGGFSSAVSAILKIKAAMLLIFLALAFAAVALEQWLSDTVGRPWGALIVCGVMLIAFTVLVLSHKRILGHTLDRIFSASFGVDTDDIKAEKKKVETELALTEYSISDEYTRAKDFVTGLTTALSFFRAFRKKKENAVPPEEETATDKEPL